MNVQRRAPERWAQNPAQHRVIHCPDMGCGAPLKVPNPPTIEPTRVTCSGTFPHTWSHRTLSPAGGVVAAGRGVVR